MTTIFLHLGCLYRVWFHFVVSLRLTVLHNCVPLFTSNHWEYCPFTCTYELMLVYNVKIHRVIYFPDLNLCKDFSVNDQATLSKAFWKSTIRRRPGIWCCLAYKNVSYNNPIFPPVYIYLPFKKPFWSSPFNFGRTVISLAVAAIHEDAILYTVFSRVIGLASFSLKKNFSCLGYTNNN